MDFVIDRCFVERLPQVAAAYARRTRGRLDDAMTLCVVLLLGRAGSRAAAKFKFSASKDTLLRVISFRRGERYGAICLSGKAPTD